MKSKENNEHYTQRLRQLLQETDDSRGNVSGVRGEVALWRAVLPQALIDATCRSAKPEARFNRREALAWLTGGGRDFAMVCDMAQVNPAYLRRMAKRCLLRREDRLNASPRFHGKNRTIPRKKAMRQSPPAKDAGTVLAVFLVQG